MNFLYLLLCALLGSLCIAALCAAAGISGKIFAAPHVDLPQKGFLPGNLAAPVGVALCSLCALGLGVGFGVLQPGKTNLWQFCAGSVLCALLALIGLWDDSLRIFADRRVGLPFGARQAAAGILCAVYIYLQSRVGGTVLVLPWRNFDLGVWYVPVCTLLCMLVLAGVQALYAKPAGLYVLCLFAAAGVLPLFGKLQNTSMSVLAAVMAGAVCTLFLYCYPAVRIYIGSCTAMFLGGVVCCVCVASCPAASTVSALPIMTVGALALAGLLFPRAKAAKFLNDLTNKTFTDICMAAGFVCAAAAGILTIYL